MHLRELGCGIRGPGRQMQKSEEQRGSLGCWGQLGELGGSWRCESRGGICRGQANWGSNWRYWGAARGRRLEAIAPLSSHNGPQHPHCHLCPSFSAGSAPSWGQGLSLLCPQCPCLTLCCLPAATHILTHTLPGVSPTERSPSQ